MKAVLVDYDRDKDQVGMDSGAPAEDWVDVCEKFIGDVHRLRDADEQNGFSGLYECFDENNNSFFYLVEEDETLFKARRKTFLGNVGVLKDSK